MGIVGYCNGQFIDVENDKVLGIEDRGHQFGDGVYEALHFYNGVCFQIERHLERCVRSLAKVRFPKNCFTKEELRSLHERLIEKSGIQNGLLYFQITRGTAPRDHHFPDSKRVRPNLTMSVRPSEINAAQQATGVRVKLVEDIRWFYCDVKSLNLLGNVLAKQEAADKGYFEALLYRKATNEITECASSNFFCVKDGILYSHPTNHLILKGVTLSVLLEDIAPRIGLNVVQKEFTPEFALAADEAFITSTGLEVTPCIEISGTTIGSGQPGPVTLQLQKAYKEEVKKACGK